MLPACKFMFRVHCLELRLPNLLQMGVCAFASWSLPVQFVPNGALLWCLFLSSHLLPLFLCIALVFAYRCLALDVFLVRVVVDMFSHHLHYDLEFLPCCWISVWALLLYFLMGQVPMSSVSPLTSEKSPHFAPCGGYFEACHFGVFLRIADVDEQFCERQRCSPSGDLSKSSDP